MATNRQKKPANDEASLFNEMKKLAKRANQRILRLERLTGKTGTFDTKQLYDYLDIDKLQAITPKGRVAVRKSFTPFQTENIIKVLNDFLEGVSTVSKVKELTKKYSKEAGVDLDYEQANTYYQAQKTYTWIYQYMTPSEFWTLAMVCVKEGWSEEKFIDNIMVYIYDRTLDEYLRMDLINLYNYIQGG